MFIDTDVLIWYMRGNKNALNLINSLPEFSISVVTYMELVQGLRNKEEFKILRDTIKEWNCKIEQINEEISSKSMFYLERFYMSHALQLADALIATTAIVNGSILITGNDTHFKIFKNLELKTFRPN